MSPAVNSSRWCPTPEQLMILEEMYRAGTRTPNASQIQQITAHLSFYGKIEGKNVFYWFQNHKARDRQKLRRKLYKQLQQQQQQQQQQQLMINSIHNQNHHFLSYIESPTPNISFASSSCSSSTSFHQQLSCYNSSPSACSIPQFQACGVEDHHHASTHHHQLTSCYTWKMEIPLEKENSMMRMYDRDWTMMVDVGPTNSPQCYNNKKPLKTLDLFPITATNLKEECSTTSKHVPHSTSATN